MNKVVLYGKIMSDIDTRSTANGLHLSRFTLGTSKKGKDGKYINKYVPVVCFGKTSELANQYLGKDKHVLVEAELNNRSWEDDTGKKQYALDVIANSLTFIGDAQKQEQTNSNEEQIPF